MADYGVPNQSWSMKQSKAGSNMVLPALPADLSGAIMYRQQFSLISKTRNK